MLVWLKHLKELASALLKLHASIFPGHQIKSVIIELKLEHYAYMVKMYKYYSKLAPFFSVWVCKIFPLMQLKTRASLKSLSL